MWESPDDARTDFFLSGAVYVLGPTILGLLLGLLPRSFLGTVSVWLALVVAFATTALVPILLARYRKQGPRHFGAGGGLPAVARGLGLALAPIAATVIAALVTPGTDLLDAFPVMALAGGQGINAVLFVLVQLVAWTGLALLLVFATVKARAAFRPHTGTLQAIAQQVGRIVAAVAGVAFIALLLSRGGPLADAGLDGRGTLASVLGLALPALGVAATFFLALRGVSGPVTTDRWTVAAPVILAALGPFSLTLDGNALFFLLYVASLFAGFALTVTVVVESRRPPEIVLALAVAIALLTSLGGFSAA